MARPRKVPAVLVEATIRENGKLAALPSDTARLGYVYVCLGAAKLLKPAPGIFTSKHHFREVAGRFAKYLEAYLGVGLLEEEPRLCDRCKTKWSKTPPTRGQIVVHDWHEHQYDPYQLERQRAYDDRQRASANGSVSDGVSDAQSDAVSDGVSDAFLTPDSRGRGRDRVPGARRTLNVEQRTKNESGTSTLGDARATEGEPLLSAAELAAWETFDDPAWQPFKRAWLGRGFRKPPTGAPDDDDTSQRGLLWQIADARPDSLGRWVKEATGKTARQVIDSVLAQWHEVRAEAAADDGPSWLGPTKTEAAESVGAILRRTAERNAKVEA